MLYLTDLRQFIRSINGSNRVKCTYSIKGTTVLAQAGLAHSFIQQITY